MARTLDAVSGSTESGSTSEQCVGEHNPQPYRVGLQQVIASLGAARPVQEARSIYKGPLTLEGEPIDEMEVVHLPPGLHKVLLGPSEKVRMARPSGSPIPIDEDKGYLCADCGASITITGSLANSTDIVEKRVMIDMAESGSTMYSSHSCIKTHFVKDRTGQIVFITTPALCVKTANQDLLSCKKCNKIGIRVILDEDPDISGLYMLDKDQQQHIQDSIPFISEDSDLYLIKIDLEMDWRKYRETTGLPMWHRRLMHCSFQNIKDTIPFTKGMEKLKNCRIDPQEKCPACAIGKSTLQDNPGPISRATQPLAKANFDVIVSSIVSIESYNYAALIVDDCTGFLSLYGMKTRDQVVDVAKRWMAEIGDLREKYPLRVVMRDNAGENKSNALREYFTSMGVENYFSTAYEPWQDGLAEAAIKSTIMTATCGMAKSGMVGKFWFKAATNGKNGWNVTYKLRIQLPTENFTERRWMCPGSDRLDA